MIRQIAEIKSETVEATPSSPLRSRWQYLSRDIAQALIEADGPIVLPLAVGGGRTVQVIISKPREKKYYGLHR